MNVGAASMRRHRHTDCTGRFFPFSCVVVHVSQRVHASWAAEAHRICDIGDILGSEAFLPILTKSIDAVLKQCNDLLMVGKKTVNIGTVLKRVESMLS